MKKEVKKGTNTSFWYDKWSLLGTIMDITGHRGCIDMGISLQSSVAKAIAGRRKRKHQTTTLNQIEEALEVIRKRG